MLKIHRSFVHRIGLTDSNGIIVRDVIGLGNSLNQHVIAEGVEEPAQLDFLKSLNCEEG